MGIQHQGKSIVFEHYDELLFLSGVVTLSTILWSTSEIIYKLSHAGLKASLQLAYLIGLHAVQFGNKKHSNLAVR